MGKVVSSLIIILISLIYLNSATAAATYKWRIAETWPANFPIFGDAVESMIRHAKDLSNGRLVITSETKEVHKKPLGIFDMVRDGEYEMGHSASYYWKEQDINTLFFSTIPFGMIAVEQYGWFYHGGGLELMQEVYGQHGLLSFPGGNTGQNMGGWFRKEIKSVADLKGLKMRIPGLAGDVMQKLGVEVQNIPPSDLYTALESGQIDALEWVGPSLDLSMGFHKIAPYYYTGWHEPASELQFMVNQEAFDSLPPDLQKVLIASMRLAAYDSYIQMYDSSMTNLKKMRSEYPDIKIRSLTSKVMRALSRETALRIEAITANGDTLTKKIVKSMNSYQEKARVWTRISDQAYLNNVGL